MAIGDTLAVFDAMAGRPPETGYARIDFRGGFAVLDFSDDQAESTSFQFVLPAHYGGGAIVLRLMWVAESATSGAVVWGGRAGRLASGAASIDALSFGARGAAASLPETSLGGLSLSTVTLASADVGSPAAGDLVVVAIDRGVLDPADTMPGDAELVALEVREG